jgi:hypothetical protein
MDDEGDLNKVRSRLGAALQSGKVYVDEKGKMQSMDAASQHVPETAKSLMQDMQARFDDSTDRLKKVIGRKNDAYSSLGIPVRVSTQQASDALDGKTGTAPAAAAPAGAAAPRVKVKLSNGKTGSIEAAQFDTKTMTRL